MFIVAGCVSHSVHLKVRRQPVGIGPLPTMCSRDQTQVVRLGGKHVFSLNQLMALVLCFILRSITQFHFIFMKDDVKVCVQVCCFFFFCFACDIQLFKIIH